MPIALSPSQTAARDLGFITQSAQSHPGVKSASANDKHGYLRYYDSQFAKRAANIEAHVAALRGSK
jgi:hypothetical protein